LSKQQHIIIFACYVGAALIAMYALPLLVFGLDYFMAILFGIVLLLSGGLVHGIAIRRVNERQTIHRLIVLRKAYNQNQEDLSRNRDELRRVYEVLEQFESRSNDSKTTEDLQEVAYEVKVLHGLFKQLYSSGKHTTRPTTVDSLDEDPTNADIGMLPAVGGRKISELSDNLILDIVRDALRQSRVDLFLQPIVSLPQRKRRFFESFIHMRSADGVLIAPEQCMGLAKEKELGLAIDNMLLFRSIQLLQKAQQHNYSTAFFCNISPNTFSDRNFFSDFIEYLESNRKLAPYIVFQLAQTDLAAHAEDKSNDLKRLTDVGYRLCMSQVTDLKFDPKELKAIGFQFVKTRIDRILSANSPYSTADIRAIKKGLDDANVDLIIENVETEQALIEISDFNIDLGQGFLFGEPRLSKDPAAVQKEPELSVKSE
jgi:cyclic-di-GMP phosphodiesterase TipF (flagellum assembly factor)